MIQEKCRRISVYFSTLAINFLGMVLHDTLEGPSIGPAMMAMMMLMMMLCAVMMIIIYFELEFFIPLRKTLPHFSPF